MSLMISLLKYEKLVFKPGIIHFSSCKKSILIDLIRRSINEIGHSKEAIAQRSVIQVATSLRISPFVSLEANLF